MESRKKEKKANRYNALKTCGWGKCSHARIIFSSNSMDTIRLIFGANGAVIFSDFMKSDNQSSLKGDVSKPCSIYIALIPDM